ncbi:DUF5675 family protein [Chondromyces crocatus]|uniref:DUF5675 domain-containing protein n=1 Tax=Chondromyces crocatus TaxID=52 RepID=A0A0K1EE37_CHOCO|nr:DUF5675 family protein [Chondromyces crocatus]AKT38848.1 uncharacterized protein CMC5_029940 [Chondromyces crocatus]
MATAESAQGALDAVKAQSDPQCTSDKQQCPKKVVILITVTRKYNYHDLGTPGDFDARLKGESKAKITGSTTEQPPGRRDLKSGNGEKEYPVPAGTYVGRVKSGSKRNRNVPGHKGKAVELLDVPNFSDILIHTGNYPSHSEGCIILAGSNAEGDQNIESSVPKVKELMDWIAEVNDEYGEENVSIEVVVKDPPAGAQPPALPKK